MDYFTHSMRSAGQTRKIVISALLLLFLPALVLVANMTTNLSRQAAGTASLSMVPSGTGVTQSGSKWILPPNTDVNVDVELRTGNEEAIAASVQLTYDPAVLQLQPGTPDANDQFPGYNCYPSGVPNSNVIIRNWVQRIDPIAPSSEGMVTIVCHMLTTAQVGTANGVIYKNAGDVPGGTSNPKIAQPTNTTRKIMTVKFRTLAGIRRR